MTEPVNDPDTYVEALAALRATLAECTPVIHYGVPVTHDQAAQDRAAYLEAAGSAGAQVGYDLGEDGRHGA